jgi:hypothetical protein
MVAPFIFIGVPVFWRHSLPEVQYRKKIPGGLKPGFQSMNEGAFRYLRTSTFFVIVPLWVKASLIND